MDQPCIVDGFLPLCSLETILLGSSWLLCLALPLQFERSVVCLHLLFESGPITKCVHCLELLLHSLAVLFGLDKLKQAFDVCIRLPIDRASLVYFGLSRLRVALLAIRTLPLSAQYSSTGKRLSENETLALDFLVKVALPVELLLHLFEVGEIENLLALVIRIIYSLCHMRFRLYIGNFIFFSSLDFITQLLDVVAYVLSLDRRRIELFLFIFTLSVVARHPWLQLLSGDICG